MCKYIQQLGGPACPLRHSSRSKIVAYYYYAIYWIKHDVSMRSYSTEANLIYHQETVLTKLYVKKKKEKKKVVHDILYAEC